VSDAAISTALSATRLRHSGVELVPTGELALGRALLRESGVEILARAKHEDYVARELTRGGSAGENPSLVAWQDLPESLRASNRRFAESVAVKLAAVGATLIPLTPSRVQGDLELNPAQLEELAQDEHERWMKDLIADGWTHTGGPKDPERKRHPLLVPWEQLDEPEREKDRDGFRALPALLARVGYELRLPTEGRRS